MTKHRKIMEAGFEAMYGFPFNIKTITTVGWNAWSAAAMAVMDGKPINEVYTAYCGYQAYRTRTKPHPNFIKPYAAMVKINKE